jgi:hypothetical protein
MKPFYAVSVFLLAAILCPGASGGDSKTYPNAKVEEKASMEAQKALDESGMFPGATVTIYVTSDSFEKVFEFYAKIGNEYAATARKAGGRVLPDGRTLLEANFLLDKAKDLPSSRHWLKIQRPYLAKVTRSKGRITSYDDVRDVTAIVETKLK